MTDTQLSLLDIYDYETEEEFEPHFNPPLLTWGKFILQCLQSGQICEKCSNRNVCQKISSLSNDEIKNNVRKASQLLLSSDSIVPKTIIKEYGYIVRLLKQKYNII